MKQFKKILIILFLLIAYNQNLSAELPYYLDFKFILNESTAGKKAQKYVKNKLEKGFNQLREKEKSIQEEEKKIIDQKN